MLSVGITSVTPAFARERKDDQDFKGHPWLHGKFEASLGYMKQALLPWNNLFAHYEYVLLSLADKELTDL